MLAERKLRGKNRLQEIEKPRGYDRGLEMEEIVGATNDTGVLILLVRWHDCEELDLLPVEEVNVKNPSEVIEFYESRCPLNKLAQERNVPNVPIAIKEPTLADQPSTSSYQAFSSQETESSAMDVVSIPDDDIGVNDVPAIELTSAEE